MKTSAVFKRAKQQLATTYKDIDSCTQEQFICIALVKAAGRTKRITDKDLERCEDILASRLGGAYTLEVWLVNKGCIPSNGWTTADKDRIQQHRHAWLDMLIAEFEAQGD